MRLVLLPFLAVACAGCVSTGRLAPVSCTGPDAPTVDVLPAERADVQPQPVGGLEAVQRRVEIPRHGLHGTASAETLVRFVVGADGAVVCSDAVRGESWAFNEAARRAVHASEFRPAEQDGRPIAVVTEIPVSFRTTPTL